MALRTVKDNFYTTRDGKKVKLEYDSTTGIVVGTIDGKVIYKDGIYDIDVIQSFGITNPNLLSTKDEKEVLHARIITEIKNIPSGIKPGFITSNQPSRDKGQKTGGQVVPSSDIATGAVPTLATSVIDNFIKDLLSPKINLDEYGTPEDRMKKLFGDKPISYPADIIPNQQDRLVIDQYIYTPPYGDIIAGGQDVTIRGGAINITNPLDLLSSNLNQFISLFAGTTGSPYFKDGAQRRTALKNKIASVILPIPNNVSDSNSANWGSGDVMNSLSMAAAGNPALMAKYAGISAALNVAADIPGGEIVSRLGEAARPLASLFEMGGIDALNNPMFKSSLYSLILKKAGYDISPETILARGYGVVPNSNLELLFNGPTLRVFQFGYMMTPRDEGEAMNIRKIIRFFKQGMAPKKKYNTGGYGGRSMVLATPNVFKLEYKTEDNKNIEGLNKFKICALTNVQTSYAEGSWLAYEKGQPVRIQLNLTFREIEPVYENDYSDKPSTSFVSTWNDQTGVTDREIGY